MANPTTNYGFVMPSPTDLVTDLPADFDVFGQAVDTQMLTNANAAIAKTIVDAKGDLISATANDTPARLAVGTNGHVLTADSTESTGIKWAAPSGGAFILTGSADFTTSSAVNINNCFSATYLNYFVKINLTAVSASDGEIQFRMRVGGSDDTTSNYIDQRILQRSTTLVGASQTAVTQRLGDMASSHIGKTMYELQLGDPFIAKPTTYIYNCNVWNGSGDNSQHRGTGCHNVSTSYDGISIYPNTGTFTGKIRVYGYTLS
jgi:hypothetical protein